MPNFNYENPTNINGLGIENREDKLFSTFLRMLSEEGYGSITLARIYEKCDTSEAEWPYKDVEELCEAVLRDAAERIRMTYEPITEDAWNYLKEGKFVEEMSWNHLERILYRHIYLCFHPKNRPYVLAAAAENQLPGRLQKVLADALEQYFGNVLSGLILAVGQVKQATVAAMITCSICGTIQMFVQQPLFCENVFRDSTRESPNYAVVEDYLNNYFLRSIKANTAINKEF